MTGQPPPTSSPHAYRYPRAVRENGSQQNPYGSRVLGRHRGRERSHGTPICPEAQKIPDCRGATSLGRPNCIRTARLSGGPEVPNCELRAARSARNRAAASERRGWAVRRGS